MSKRVGHISIKLDFDNGKRYCERYKIFQYDKNTGYVSTEKAKQKLEELIKKSNLEFNYKQLAEDKSIRWIFPELPEIIKRQLTCPVGDN